MSGDHNMRGEDDDEISTSTHFLPKPKTYGCDQNEFSPDWDQMAVLVTHSQEQAAKIEQLEKQVRDIQVTAIAEATEVDRLREALEQAEQEPSQWRDMVVVNLVREGINKHKARELADHFTTPPAAQPEQVDCPRCGHVCSQRKWQGLTDEDVNRESAMIASQMKLAFHAGMYVAQQILKERNT
jgi:RNA polymerase subunit RPABC4/transcription elongation factor Spt4